ncbi:MAG: hypothetical protein A3J66_01040 [Candidatus Magasanikbacteria bacterium RIFCSPHIGHO2_02_FULL_47_14]|uniref:Uncharacterized protein n=1 Tax=Candidatus Magasanikbacteria bacterium RIFCSPHIGHO2_02_FULL_47_14 TaxID=1798680 RepID=A0A1F6M2Z6_9BACT|nr:MAG: hypothetical protein A3J66_01040 [Candidatus Magasanikbacteria bacterium RIFCSPHIGHO2_02_FULL_47_14]
MERASVYFFMVGYRDDLSVTLYLSDKVYVTAPLTRHSKPEPFTKPYNFFAGKPFQFRHRAQ